VPRERVLTDEELKRIWNAAGDSTFGDIVKLLILTGQRRGEICGLTGGRCRLKSKSKTCRHTRRAHLTSRNYIDNVTRS
jgi:integrase